MDGCGICGNGTGNTICRAREMMFGWRDEFDYVLCGRCGALQIAQVPAELARYYPSEYYSFAKPSAARHDRFSLKRTLRRAGLKHLAGRGGLAGALAARLYPANLPEWLAKLRLDPDARVLDIGCGAGQLLARLRRKGFRQLTGIDAFIAGDLVVDQGLRLLKRTLAGLDETFDVLMLHHSLEHMPAQLEVFRQLAKLLRPGGTVLIRTPVVPSFAWEHYGVNWVQLDAPRHLCIHSVTSLRMAAAAAGLRVTEVSYDSTEFQLWGSEQYTMGIPLTDARSQLGKHSSPLFSPEELARFRGRAKELNAQGRGDQACFILGH